MKNNWSKIKIKCPCCGRKSPKSFVGIDKNYNPYRECKCGTVMDENGVDKTEEYYGGTV